MFGIADIAGTKILAPPNGGINPVVEGDDEPELTALYGPQGFGASAPDLPSGWYWSSLPNSEDGAVDAAADLDGDGAGLLLAPSVPGGGTTTQTANLDYITPAGEPHALSLRWRMRLATFDPLVHSAAAQLNWDALGPITLSSQGSNGWRFQATAFAVTDSDFFDLPDDGLAHWYELMADAAGAGGVGRARLDVDGDPVITFEDAAGDPIPSGYFVGAGFQAYVVASTSETANAPPAIHIDAVTVADGEQGVPE